MAFSPRCSKKATGALCVKCLAPAVLGLVFGRGLAVVLGQNTAASQSPVFGWQLGVKVAGQSGVKSVHHLCIGCSGS
jgi:hypothetical protein